MPRTLTVAEYDADAAVRNANTFAERLRAARLKANLTQSQLAEKMMIMQPDEHEGDGPQVSQALISRLERDTQAPHRYYPIIRRIAEVLDADFTWLTEPPSSPLQPNSNGREGALDDLPGELRQLVENLIESWPTLNPDTKRLLAGFVRHELAQARWRATIYDQEQT